MIQRAFLINCHIESLPEIEEKVYSLLQGACLTQMALILAVRHWVKKELIPRHLQEDQITEAPKEYSRAYFATKEDIRSMAHRAIVQQRSSLLDQDAVENYQAKKHQEIDFYLHKYKAPRNWQINKDPHFIRYPMPIINYLGKSVSNACNLIFLAHREAKPVAEYQANRTGTQNGE